MAQITRGTTPLIEVVVDADLIDYTNYLSIGKAGDEMLTVQTVEHEPTFAAPITSVQMRL